jgi:hypothetical protein
MVQKDDVRLTEIRREIAARLRSVCAGWPDEVFNEMVDRLAYITVRYDGLATDTYDRRTTDRLVADLKSMIERSESARRPPDDANT